MKTSRAILSLVLLVTAPTLGVLAGMVLFPDTRLGAVCFGLSKAWLFGLPLAWRLWIDREPVSWSPPRRGGFGMALLSGLTISALILAGYFRFGNTVIDHALMAQKMRDVGLGTLPVYLAAALYWILVNSVLEEYVWRWFCVQQCETLLPPRGAIFASAFFFTIHHAIALSVFLKPWPVVLCSLGVFTGGAIWSLMYLRYRSIWPGYVSHAIVDLCVFGIGAAILFNAH
jgi:membrane protease YdiL (CAAX protease family)